MANDQLLTNSLPFVVQYRRKESGAGWIDMVAFDLQGPAESYRDKCSGDEIPWEYRLDDRSPPKSAAPAPALGRQSAVKCEYPSCFCAIKCDEVHDNVEFITRETDVIAYRLHQPSKGEVS